MILFCNGKRKSEIGSDKLVEGSLVTLLNPLGELYFLFRTYERFATYILQILVKRSAVAIRNGLINL